MSVSLLLLQFIEWKNSNSQYTFKEIVEVIVCDTMISNYLPDFSDIQLYEEIMFEYMQTNCDSTELTKSRSNNYCVIINF